MKADISIIIPIYKGQRYIPYWINKIGENIIHLNKLQMKCELILVNDFPEEQIRVDGGENGGFVLKVLNSKVNRGIQGARICGLEHAEGEWVVFLDQDDWITDDYLLKQKVCIEDADAVICNGYVKLFCKDISNFIYADHEEQMQIMNLSFYISTGNPIYSPGQVMLKRKAIPDLWCQHKLKFNGADDYYLWILMLKEGKRFVLNEERLYTHVGHGNNASNDVSSMACSIREVEQILVENNLLDDIEKQIILGRKIPELNRKRSADIIAVYDYWMYLEKRNQSVADFLDKHGFSKVGVYGMGSLGNRLCDFLSTSDIEIVFAIDQRAKKFTCSIPVFSLDDVRIENYIRQVDVIIVTAESAFESVKEEVNKMYGISVLSFKNILLEMIDTML